MIISDPITLGGDYNAVVNAKDIPFLNMEKQRRWDVIISIFYILNGKKRITVYTQLPDVAYISFKKFFNWGVGKCWWKKILIIEDHALKAGFGFLVI